MITRLKNISRQMMHRSGFDFVKKPSALLAHPMSELSISADVIASYCGLTNADSFFVQIGANDGITDDPLHSLITRYQWKGVLVEPQGDVFEQLKQNYIDQPQLIFKNVAISNQSEERMLYRIRSGTEGPYWLHKVASFNREGVVKNAKQLPDGESLVVEEPVRCITFDTLAQECGISHIDWLQIDAEGYDFEILKMVNFAKLKPRVICYEHRALSKSDWNMSVELLISHGYHVAKIQNDTIACIPVY